MEETQMPIELSQERSEEMAVHIKQIMQALPEIDLQYGQAVVARMKKGHSFKESAAVLNPNPFTHRQQMDLSDSKIRQLELIMELRANYENIKNQTIILNDAKDHVDEMAKIFNI